MHSARSKQSVPLKQHMSDHMRVRGSLSPDDQGGPPGLQRSQPPLRALPLNRGRARNHRFLRAMGKLDCAKRLIGNGARSEFQAIAFHHMLGIRELRLYDTDPAAVAKLECNLRSLPELHDLTVVRASSAAEAGVRRRHRDDRDRRQAQCDHSDSTDDRAGDSLELLPHYPQWRQQVDLVPDLENPKDLFGGTLGSKVKARMRRVA